MKFESIYWASIGFTEDTSRSVHTLSSEKFITVFIGRTGKINHSFDSDLDYELRTFIASRHCTVKCCSFHISPHRIENSIRLCMDDIGML